MESTRVRNNFLNFFAEKGHKIVPSAPVVNNDDAQLFFINAGMNPFKDHFLGNTAPPALRVANSQCCLRVSGKHNDLEEVGFDTYHHTCFEMLGNWSFGDYFKQEAIAWAWEFAVNCMGLPKNRLYATVFGGDKGDNLPQDDETMQLWRSFLPTDHVLFCGKADNFWEMGAVGPCGPCTELHVDLRSEEQRQKKPASALINKSDPEVMELWNLVFMQYDRKNDGKLSPLPTQHVDTGMGFERLCMIAQGKTSAYDSDIFQPLLQGLSNITGREYGETQENDVACRVIVDHVRAMVFAMADGLLPAATQAGYVLRRLLRRALRYGYTFLDCKEPFIHRLVPLLSKQYGTFLPNVKAQEPLIMRLIEEEERVFMRTLEGGLRRLSVAAEALPSGAVLPGKAAFELHDTYGFPLDLTLLIAKERGLSVDKAAYQEALSKQRLRSQAATDQTEGDWEWCGPEATEATEATAHSTFEGYDRLEVETHFVRYRKIHHAKGAEYEVVLERTPFYPTGGGQLGDSGAIYVDGEAFEVRDTVRAYGCIIHKMKRLPNEPNKPNAPVRAVVDAERRMKTQCNHTATHLLHAALRHILGDHVAQRGSQVSAEGLRFDYSHHNRLEAEEIDKIERLVNAKICENLQLEEDRSVPLEEAKKRGAQALFGEKYGEKVRLITFEDTFSVELCAGTHAPATGHLGLFKFSTERALAAGVRRIEAVTREKALTEVQAHQKELKNIHEMLNYPKDVQSALQQQLEEKKKLEKSLDSYEERSLLQQKQALKTRLKPMGGFQILVEEVLLSKSKQLRSVAFELGAEVPALLAILVSEIEKKPYLAVYVDKKQGEATQIKANELCSQLAKYIGGHGGGQVFFAMAGGRAENSLSKVIDEAWKQLHALLGPTS